MNMDDVLNALTDAERQIIPLLKREREQPVLQTTLSRSASVFENRICDGRFYKICNDAGLDYPTTAFRFMRLGLLRQDIGRSGFIVTGMALAGGSITKVS